jgi:hypothetical protein
VRAAASGSAACANAPVEDINANENTDAPKTKARECLTPKAITAPTCSCISWVWLAGAA